MYKNYLLGALFKVLSLLSFCLLSIWFERLKAPQLDSVSQFGIVCLIGSLMLLPAILFIYPTELKRAQFKLYPIRAVVSIISMVTWIESMKYFGSAESTLVGYLAPMITIILASLTKDEQPKLVFISLGILCYAVIFFALQTHIKVATYGFLMALISAICYSIYEIICKKQSVSEHFMVQVFYTFSFAALLLAPFIVPKLSAVSAENLVSLAAIAFLRILTVVFLFLGIKFATLNSLAPVSYSQFPLMVGLNWLLFNTSCSMASWVAALLLAIINLLTAMYVARWPGGQAISNPRRLVL